MSKIAYLDFNRTRLVLATSAELHSHSIRYFCPNSVCSARMHIVQGKDPYFAADKCSPHSLYCPYAASSTYDSGKYDEKAFSLSNFIDNLLRIKECQGSSSNSSYKEHEHSFKLPIKTLRVLYDMCKSRGINEEYNFVPIRDLIFDMRCDKSQISQFSGFKIFECQSYSRSRLDYDKESSTIKLFTPVNSDKRVCLTLKLDNMNLFWDVESKLYNNRDKLIVVAGIWSPNPNDGGLTTTIQNKQQISVIK